MFTRNEFMAMATLLVAMAAPCAFARPGDAEPLNAVNPAYTLEQARPDGFKPQVGAMAFLPDGKLAVTSFMPANDGVFKDDFTGTLYIIDNPTEKNHNKITYKKISTELHDPLGANVVEGTLYLCDRNEITKWTDSDNDGYPDKKQTIASGWISDNYHHFTFGLPYHDGHFYITLSTTVTFKQMIKDENVKGEIIAYNGPNPADRGCLLKVNAKTGQYSQVVGGLRTPNGVSLGPEENIIIPDNQGAWKPASGIYVAKQGAFYGHYNNTEATSDFYPDGGVPAAFSDQPITSPAIWIPQNECANSPGQLIKIPEGHPHAGQYLMTELFTGGLRRVFFEKIGDTWQGAIFKHSQGFEVGTNRIALGPDGCIYVGGTGSERSWTWRGTKFGLQRMRPTGKTAFEFSKIEATKEGYRLTFTKPVDQSVLEDIASYQINSWTYKPVATYGGPKIDEANHVPTQAVAAADGLSVELTLPNRTADHVFHIRADVSSKSGEQMWSPEAWATFHKAPQN